MWAIGDDGSLVLTLMLMLVLLLCSCVLVAGPCRYSTRVAMRGATALPLRLHLGVVVVVVGAVCRCVLGGTEPA